MLNYNDRKFSFTSSTVRSTFQEIGTSIYRKRFRNSQSFYYAFLSSDSPAEKL